MKGRATSCALHLLLVVMTGGLFAPVVHRVQHSLEWQEEREAALRLAHAHQHHGVTLCEATASVPAVLQDSPCVLCSGLSAFTGLHQLHTTPELTGRPLETGLLHLPRSRAVSSQSSRGPPALFPLAA